MSGLAELPPEGRLPAHGFLFKTVSGLIHQAMGFFMSVLCGRISTMIC
jgi:hypothetical protein